MLLTAILRAAHGADDADELNSIGLEDLSGRLDLSIPQSPAFAVLGVSPEKVVQSDNFRDVALGVLHGLDPRGNLQSGVAVDVRPFIVIAGSDSTLADYRGSRTVRLLTNTQVSFATASGKSSTDKADRLGLGVRVTLWQEYDPALGGDHVDLVYAPAANGETRPIVRPAEAGKVRGSLDSCYISYLTDSVASPEVLPDDAGLTALEEDIAKKSRRAVKECLEPYKKQHWNAGALDVGVGGHRSKVDPLSESGFGVWLGYSHSLGRNGQFVARALRTDNLLQPLKDARGSYRIVDESSAGLRVRFGSERGSVMLEGEWIEGKVHDGANDSYSRAALGIEFEAIRDVWLQLGVGKAFSTQLFDDDPVYSGQIRLGFAEQSLFQR